MSATLTNEQITKLVEGMRAQLDTCVPKGQAYRVKWHDVKEIIAVITTLQQRLTEANDFNNDVVEREAALCPEDVGFDEYIRTLQSRLVQVEKDVSQWQGVAEKYQALVARTESDTATRMREACVAAVRRASYYHDSRCLCVTAIHGPCDCGAKARYDKLMTELQSLTLDQVE